MEYLKIWCSFAEIIEPLNDAERGRLFTAMLEYAERGTPPEFKGNERYIWPMAKQSIDRARDESDRKRENGQRGGRPRKPEETSGNQEKPNETSANQAKANENYKEKEKDKDNGKKETPLSGCKEKTAARFTPPTVEEVAAYCRERGNKVDPQRFVDFYTAKGWRVGNQPMKDWRAAVRTWEHERAGPGKTVSAQQYQQREYEPGYLDSVGEDLIAAARQHRDEEASAWQ